MDTRMVDRMKSRMYVRMDMNGCGGGFEEVYGRTEFIINKHPWINLN
jgi:hypothetical protein